jgi:hypothetical protein
MADINIKRGATLSETLSFTTAGAPTVLTGMTMQAIVRTAEGALVATLTPVPTSTAGQATIYVQDTSAWPEGLLAVDVMIAAPGGAQTLSQTFSIEVEHAETYTLPPQVSYDPVAD